MTVPLLSAERRWSCPLCAAIDVTHEAQPHVRFHACPAQAGMTVPMVPSDVRHKVTRLEREDYIGDELVQRDADGRPLMALQVERDDGFVDTVVYAPMARSRAQTQE